MALEFLKEARKERGLRQADMAKMLGVAMSTYNGIERGSYPGAAAVYAGRIGEILGVDPFMILKEQAAEPAHPREWLIKARKEKRMSQLVAGELCGISQTAMCLIEKGVLTPRRDVAEALADLLGVDAERFYEEGA